MEVSNIKYKNVYVVNRAADCNDNSIVKSLNELYAMKFTEIDYIVDYSSLSKNGIDIMATNPIRRKLIQIQKDMVLRFVFNNQDNFDYQALKKLRKLILSMIKSNNSTVSNAMAVERIRNLAMWHGLC